MKEQLKQILLDLSVLKKELDIYRPLDKDTEARIMQKFRLDWNYHSNHLEGNQLTYGETKALILFGITAQGKTLRDHFEVTGHNEAIEWILDIIKQERPLSEQFIRELHTLILKEPYEVNAVTNDGKPTKKKIKVGEYKSMPNHVETKTGEIFYFATPEETPAKMHDLIQWYRGRLEDEDTNPVLLAAEFHHKFICIHPFDDGNGRTARILMNFILMQFDYPPVIIKTEDKSNYFSALQQADAGMLDAFVKYIAENLIYSLELMVKGAKGESVEDTDDLDKEIALLEQELKGHGDKIELVRSKDVLEELAKNQLVDIADIFVEVMSKMSNFYLETHYDLNYPSSPYGDTMLPFHYHQLKLGDLYLSIQESINTLSKLFISYPYEDEFERMFPGQNRIDIECEYKIFNKHSISIKSYICHYSIYFYYKSFAITLKYSQENSKLEYLYHQSINKEKLKAFFAQDVKKHMEYIKEQIANSK